MGLAYLMLCVAITVGLLGKRLNARVQAWTVLATASIIVAASLLGFGQMEPGHFAVVFPHGYWAVGSAAGLIVWCYVGVENLSFISSDFRNPGRDVLRSILVGTAAVAGLYLAAGVAVIGVLAPDEWGVIKAPFVHVLSRVLGAGFASAAVLTSLGITFASAITIAWGGSNLCSSMAERGSLPAWLAERTDRGVARRAMLFIWALYSLAMAAIYYCDLDLSRLAQVVGAAVLVTYVLSALAYVRLLERDRWLATLTLAGSLGLMPFSAGSCCTARHPRRLRALRGGDGGRPAKGGRRRSSPSPLTRTVGHLAAIATRIRAARSRLTLSSPARPRPPAGARPGGRRGRPAASRSRGVPVSATRPSRGRRCVRVAHGRQPVGDHQRRAVAGQASSAWRTASR